MGAELAEYPEARPTIAAGLHEHGLIGFRESLIYRIDADGIFGFGIWGWDVAFEAGELQDILQRHAR